MNNDFKDWPQTMPEEAANVAQILLNLSDEYAAQVMSYLINLPGPLGVRGIQTGMSVKSVLKIHGAGDARVPVILVTDEPEAWIETKVDEQQPRRPILVVASDNPLSEEASRQLMRAFQVQRMGDTVAPLENRIGACVQTLLYPILIGRLQRQVADQRETEALIKHIGKELSVFYHGFNNPLTVLSGNIQLLQILAETMQIPDDIMKPIQDINGISTRFIHDLALIEELKEMIRDLEL